MARVHTTGVRAKRLMGATRLGFNGELWRVVGQCWPEDCGARPDVEGILSCLNSSYLPGIREVFGQDMQLTIDGPNPLFSYAYILSHTPPQPGDNQRRQQPVMRPFKGRVCDEFHAGPLWCLPESRVSLMMSKVRGEHFTRMVATGWICASCQG